MAGWSSLDPLEPSVTLYPVAFPYLTPGASKPLNALLTVAVVADLRGGRSIAAAALQREAANLVGEADHCPGSHTYPTLSWALQVQADWL